MIEITSKGDFRTIYSYLGKLSKWKLFKLDALAQQGVQRLNDATPKDTGKTANSWSYTIDTDWSGVVKLSFENSNFQNGVPVAIILQYGHATRNGGWVEGIDYINPAVAPIFKEIADMSWKEVTRL